MQLVQCHFVKKNYKNYDNKPTNMNLFKKQIQHQLKDDKVDIQIDDWQVLAAGGSNWIFKTKQHKNMSNQNMNNLIMFDHLIMKIKLNTYLKRISRKWKNQLIKIVYQLSRKHTKLENNFLSRQVPQNDFKDKKTDSNNIKKQIQLSKQNIFNDLIELIYQKFLNLPLNTQFSSIATSKFCQTRIKQENKQKLHILPKIHNKIIKQSQAYLYVFKQKEQQKQLTECNRQLKDFLLKSINKILYFWLKQMLEKQNQETKRYFDSNQTDILTSIKNIQLNIEQIITSLKQTNLSVTFEDNLCSQKSFSSIQQLFKERLIKQNKNVQIVQKVKFKQLDESFDNIQKVKYQVFEVKPKSILPDIYSDILVQQLCRDYSKTRQKHYKKHQSLQKIQNNQTSQYSPSKQKIIHVIQQSFITRHRKSLQQQGLYKQSFIYQQIKQNIYQNDIKYSGLNDQSTRWFKKSCLSDKQKKKNQNPNNFFYSCLHNYQSSKKKSEQQHEQNKQKQIIDYYTSKHLRTSKLFQINQAAKVSKQMNKTNIQQLKQTVNMAKSNKQLNDDINRLITQINYNSTQIKSQTSRLSLIDQIMALQLINFFVQKVQAQQMNHLQQKSRQQQRSQLKDQYFDIIQLSLMVDKLMNNKILNNQNIQSNKKQPLYPQNSLRTIHHIIKPQILQKSRKLSQHLKSIIFQSLLIQEKILQVLNHQSKQISHHRHEIYQTKIYIFNVVAYLISLTWKDISFMVQSLTYKDQGSQGRVNLNLNIYIIDWKIKFICSIKKNAQKDKQFLYYYLEYKRKIEKQKQKYQCEYKQNDKDHSQNQILSTRRQNLTQNKHIQPYMRQISNQNKSKLFNIILVRHAQSHHNITRRQARKLQYTQNHKYLQIKKHMKHSSQFIDSQYINIQQIQPFLLNFQQRDQIKLIIVSPLERCIKTALFLKNNHEIPIFLEPLITSPVVDSWTIGRSLKHKKLKYGNQLNFQSCPDQIIHWSIDKIIQDSSQNHKQNLYQKLKSIQNQSLQQDLIHQKILLQYLQNHKIGESSQSVISRIQKFKQKLINYYLPMINQNKHQKILIVTHSQIIKVIFKYLKNDLKVKSLGFIYCTKQLFKGKQMQ